MHWGDALCDEKLFDADIKKIAENPLARWIGGGDYCRLINRQDRRHRESELADWLHGEDDVAGLQTRTFIERIEPIKDKCLGLVKGNHEDDILARYERDVYSSIVNAMTDPERKVRLDIGGFVIMNWMRNNRTTWRMIIFAHHGSGGGLLPGGHALTLGRLPTWYEFDVALLGHRHVKQWVPNTFTGPNQYCTGFTKKPQHMMFGGTYLDAVANENQEESYAERKLLPPSGVGVVQFRVRPTSKEIHCIV